MTTEQTTRRIQSWGQKQVMHWPVSSKDYIGKIRTRIRRGDKTCGMRDGYELLHMLSHHPLFT